MNVQYFPPRTLGPGENWQLPPLRLLVYTGSWQRVARDCSTWFAATFRPRSTPPWTQEVEAYTPEWVPDPENAHPTSQPIAPSVKGFSNFAQLSRLYLGDQYMLKEWAMYNSKVLVGVPPGDLGYCRQADGTYCVRYDLGGAAAAKQGVAAAHRIGRRAIFYVEGLVVRKCSDLTLGGVAADMALMNKDGKHWEHYPDHWHMCPGSIQWQDHMAQTCKRLLWETGADGIRLDSLGYYFVPCYNPAHHHENPFGWNQWIREYFRKIRAAMDEVNPQAILLTECPVDFYNESTNGALALSGPLCDIAPLRLVAPDYRMYGYSAGLMESVLNGWVFGWGALKSANGQPFPDDAKPRWPELRATFAETLLQGDPCDQNSVAPDDPRWIGRLWRGPRYWMLVGGRMDLASLNGPTRVNLPKLPDGVRQAWEFDPVTLNVRDAGLHRTEQGAWVTVTHSSSAVLLPLPDCPPLLGLDRLPANLRMGQEVRLHVTAWAPWRAQPQAPVSVMADLPGLAEPRQINIPGEVIFTIPAKVEPGHYYLHLHGDGLPLKRWLKVNE